jgi:hypothetical protein
MAGSPPRGSRVFLSPIESYRDNEINSIVGKLVNRIQEEPLNFVATVVFLCAIIHTFLAPKFLDPPR